MTEQNQLHDRHQYGHSDHTNPTDQSKFIPVEPSRIADVNPQTGHGVNEAEGQQGVDCILYLSIYISIYLSFQLSLSFPNLFSQITRNISCGCGNLTDSMLQLPPRPELVKSLARHLTYRSRSRSVRQSNDDVPNILSTSTQVWCLRETPRNTDTARLVLFWNPIDPLRSMDTPRS